MLDKYLSRDVKASAIDMSEAVHFRSSFRVADGCTDTVARALVRTWVSRFGIPSTITTDRDE